MLLGIVCRPNCKHCRCHRHVSHSSFHLFNKHFLPANHVPVLALRTRDLKMSKRWLSSAFERLPG